ncbi:MAG: A/G-specific adenine glycosylase, partial [Flavobacteriales bacterium]
MSKRGFLQKNWHQSDAERARQSLSTWYGSHARDLPWRLTPSLYGTWLSEIMLQQTRVDTGIPKWHLFLELFPTVHDLAQASEAEVMKAWEGLGYYRRARLLHKAAKVVAARGAFPGSREDWLALPGVGPYTSAAIASIGLGEAVAAVDGNVQRVMSRWGGVTEPVDGKLGAQAIQEVADAWLDHDRPGDHNQAVMELG